MNWTLLIIAGLLEIVWAICLKNSEGFTRLWPSVSTVVFMAASVILLAFSVRSLPIGTAFAVWTGIGMSGTAIAGIILFGESASLARLLCIALILCGVAGLKISASHKAPNESRIEA